MLERDPCLQEKVFAHKLNFGHLFFKFSWMHRLCDTDMIVEVVDASERPTVFIVVNDVLSCMHE